MITPSSPANRHPRPARSSANEGRRLKSEQLLEGAKEIVIEHGAQEYRLRVTASGKLILTK